MIYSGVFLFSVYTLVLELVFFLVGSSGSGFAERERERESFPRLVFTNPIA